MIRHEPVLLSKLLEALRTDPSGSYVDATFGRGGHSRGLLASLTPEARLLVIDRDPEAIAEAERLAAEDRRVIVRRGHFGELAELAHSAGIEAAVGVMFDLGVSSPQLDDPGRGFSFRADGPLDMRMNPLEGESAEDWLNSASEDDLTSVFRDYGEERHARRIARRLIERRAAQRITTTGDLVSIVVAAQPRPDPHKHAATRVFQAIRIRINDELSELERGLSDAFDMLVAGGRLAVISFHSLEDRIVKRAFAQWVRPAMPRRLPVVGVAPQRARHTLKGVRADADEVARNPRARSAMLRVLEKCA